MCSVDTYDIEHVPMPSYASSGGVIPISSASSRKLFFSLGRTMNFLKIVVTALMKNIRTES